MNWKKNYFTLLQTVLLVIGASLIILFNKGELELLINRKLTSPVLDVFFKYVTHLGDGLILLPLFILMLFIKYRYAAFVAIMALYQLIIVHINKRIIFSNMPRPKVFLEGHDLHFVNGVDIHSYNSFPSGHTATAFAVYFLLAILIDKKGWSIFLFFLSITIGFSRVYLMQHFIIDVYAGSIAGCLATLLAYFTIKKIDQKKVLDRKLSF